MLELISTGRNAGTFTIEFGLGQGFIFLLTTTQKDVAIVFTDSYPPFFSNCWTFSAVRWLVQTTPFRTILDLYYPCIENFSKKGFGSGYTGTERQANVITLCIMCWTSTHIITSCVEVHVVYPLGLLIDTNVYLIRNIWAYLSIFTNF